MTGKRKFLAYAIACAPLGLSSAMVMAQGSVLEEIVVTANKRQQSINDVGLTVTALSGDAIRNRQITNPEEFAAIVPGLALAPSSHNTPVYTLRGVGYNADALAVYPAVSLYLDEAPMPFPVLGGRSLFDLERIEVLKGPQGTLFGQNSTGGAINYIAAKPTTEPTGSIEVGYGRFSEFTANGFVSGPVSDSTGVRLAFDYRNRDEWQRSYTRDDELGAQEYVAARLIVESRPTDRLSLLFNLNGSIDKSDPQAKQTITIIPSAAGAPTEDEANYPLIPGDDARLADWSPDPYPEGDRKIAQASLRIDYDITDAVTLTSLSTYNHLDQDPVTDLDGAAPQFADNPQDEGEIRTFNQELRLSNAGALGASVRWTLGTNYETAEVKEDQHIAYGDNSLSNAANLFINVSGIDSEADIESYAVFGNMEYDLSEDLTLRAGARYTDMTNDTYICGYSPGDGRVAELFTLLGEIFAGQRIELGPRDCYTLNEQLLPGDPFVSELSEDNVSWKVGADYRLNMDTLLYLNVSRGYKAGSFPAITASVQSALIPAIQESVLSYELGTKATLLDGRMQANAAVFYQEYEDKQIQGTLKDDLFGLLQQLQNVPESRILGAEADVSWVPVNGLTLTGTLSYLDTEVEKFESTDIYGNDQDFSGDRLPFAPEWAAVFDVDYRMPLGARGERELFMGFTYNYRTDADAYIGGSRIPLPDRADIRTVYERPFIIDGYTTVDARLGLQMLENGLTITAWGKNLFDEFYATNLVSNSDVVMRMVGQPRTYGVTLAYDF
ncbi:TonB-dependent receptor [Kineobactrum sediminis]|uniref:TonB-dependent receptor n=1 Tax=Kineobactrum sediminis TaxID=1905677 RepID=A0A2N5Y0B5_9GAMM|nr:TonB-dependent receptor [Kineobactrum sediminis]PLW81799.1 TonB-dependent receptor [Kineobactrum sediminis]